MQHLDEGTVHAWLDGALPAEQSADVERHVAQCKECASLVAEARGMVAGASRIVSALDVVPGGVIPKAQRAATSSRSLWRSLQLTPSRAALAATLVIAVSTLLTLRHNTPNKIVPTAAPASPVVASASPPASAPRDEGVGARQKTDVAPSAAKAAKSERRGVADTRIRITDSTSAVSAKASVAEVTTQNAASAQQRVAAAPPSTPTPSTRSAASGVSGAGAVAADVARPLAKVSADTARQAAGAPVRAFESSRLQRADAVREAIDTLASRSAAARARLAPRAIFAGCYELVVDSALKDSAIPRRFALAPVSPDTAENVVHVVTSDGRMGDVILGSRWMQLSSNTIKVQFAALDKPHSATIRLGLEAKSFNRSPPTTGMATIVGDKDQALLTVRHDSCRP